MAPWWENYPWREIQTNLREIDMRDISAEQVVADLQSFQATLLMINAAGIIASYPTELPFHFQSPYLTGDSLVEIIDACHAADIRVVARTDFSKVRRPIYEMHPEWAYISKAGDIIDYNGDVAVCLSGDYQQHYALKIIEECLNKHDFDGIFFNMGGYQTRDYSGNYYGPCHCPNCQQKFAEMFGLAIPVGEDMDDPHFRKYVQFKTEMQRAQKHKVYTFISERWPNVCIDKHFQFRKGFIRQESNTAVDRPLPHWQYSGSDNTKWAVSSYPNMVATNTTVDFIDFPYRHVAVSPHQQKLRLIQALANGGALDYYLIGRLDNHEDRSGYAGVREIFHYHAANEDSYRGLTSKSTVGIINGPQSSPGEFRGWFRFLAESHYGFDTIMDDVALELPWDKYSAMVLPDYQPVSDELAARLDDFAENGGTVIATGRSGFRTEHFDPRARSALRCLGIENVQRVRTDTRSCYFKVDDKAQLPRLSEIDLLYLDGPYVYANYADSATSHLRLIPPHLFGPPERCYYTQVTEHPGFVVNKYGSGRGIYLPWLPGALFHRQGYPNTSEFIADLLEQVAGLPPFGGTLSPMVEVTHFTNPDAGYDLVHLVNASGHFGTSFYAPITMVDQRVSVGYPQQPASVRSLVTGDAHEYTWQDGRLTIEVPRLEAFQALRVESTKEPSK